jgi:hypothetical protein
MCSASAISCAVLPLAREGPGDGQAVAATAAEQFRDGDTQALSHRIEQRGLDGAFREVIADDGLAQHVHDQSRARGIALEQQRFKIDIDGELDAFGTLRTVA